MYPEFFSCKEFRRHPSHSRGHSRAVQVDISCRVPSPPGATLNLPSLKCDSNDEREKG